ncbi:MAG: glycine oxidase ThiO [Gemmatimonadota bacterium]
MPRDPDAIVVGGGLVGCLAARALAAHGRTVTLFERGRRPGGGASTAAAGMLSPQMEWAEGILVGGDPEAARAEAMLDLCVAARARWPAFARALEAESGRSLCYRTEGTLVVALTAAAAAELEAQARSQVRRGLRAEWLDTPTARRLEPGISPAARGALFLPDDHQVEPLPLMAAAIDVLARPGLRVVTGVAVAAVESAGGRVAGVRTVADPGNGGGPAGEEVTRAPWVVLAAGAWSAAIRGLPRPLPVRPVKGQMAAVRPAEMPIRHVVGCGGAYCVPRDDGRIVVGATVEEAGFDDSLDPAATEALVQAVAAAVPALGGAPIEARWSGLRPGTADDLPILGEDPELPGLLYATGHYRNGILLAPLSADLVAGLVRGEAPPADLAPFSAARPALVAAQGRT